MALEYNLNRQKKMVEKVLSRIEEEYLIKKSHWEKRLKKINLELNTIDITATVE